MKALGPDQRAEYERVGVVEGYDLWCATYDTDPNPLITVEQPVTLELLGDARGLRVLDLGCGTGRYCALLAARGARVVGLDPSEGMLDRARHNMADGARVELVRGTLETARFAHCEFDLVICALTLCHILDIEPVLAEIARVLRPGGRLLVSDIHPFWPVSGHNYAEFFDPAGREYRIPVHVHLVSEYAGLFRRLGMSLYDLREPCIGADLVARFPSLSPFEGVPLAIVMEARK